MKPGQPFDWKDENKGSSAFPKRPLKILILLMMVVLGLLVSRLPFLEKEKVAPPSRPVMERPAKNAGLFRDEQPCDREWNKDSSEVLLRCGRPGDCVQCIPDSAARNLCLHIVERAVAQIASPESLEVALKRTVDEASPWRLASLNFFKSNRRIRFSGTPIPLSRSSLWLGGFRLCSEKYGCLGGGSAEAKSKGPDEVTGNMADPGKDGAPEAGDGDSLLSTSYWPMPHMLIATADSMRLVLPFPGVVSEIRLNHSGGKRVQVFHKGGLFSYYEGRYHVRKDLALGALLEEGDWVGLAEAGEQVRFFMEDKGLYVDPENFKSRLATKFAE